MFDSATRRVAAELDLSIPPKLMATKVDPIIALRYE